MSILFLPSLSNPIDQSMFHVGASGISSKGLALELLTASSAMAEDDDNFWLFNAELLIDKYRMDLFIFL